jgi:hypothetical protein
MGMRAAVICVCCFGCLSAFGAIDLKESKFTQVVNNVEVISTSDNSKHPAAVDSLFKMPDVVRTGAASRAELVAEDRTITRIGANTIFSFDAARRRIDLDQGSLLFNAPKGKGGGTIHTAAATAAVLGTTIIVVTTPNGGFKVLTLEGTAEVDFSNGDHRRIKAGQLIFVLPGGFPGPTLAFRLDTQVAGSLLVSGFANPLPSLPLIQTAINGQIHQLQNGRAVDTGLLVGNTATPNTVQVINPIQQYNAIQNPSTTTPAQVANNGSGGTTNQSGPVIPTAPPGTIVPSGSGYLNPDGFVFTSAPTNSGGPGAAYAMGPATATLSDVTINTPMLDPTHVFTAGVTVSIPAQSFNGLVDSGFYARNITISTPSIDFSSFADAPAPPANFIIFASENMTITGNLSLTTFATDLILVAGGTLSIPAGAAITGNSTDLEFDSRGSLNISSASLQNTGGNLLFFSYGSLTLNNSTLTATMTGGSSTVVLGNNSGGTGSVTLDNTTVSGNAIVINSPTTLTLSGETAASGQLTSTGISLAAGTGMTVGVNLSTPSGAGAIVLNNTAGTLTVNNGAQLTSGDIEMTSGNGITIDSVAPIIANTMTLTGGNHPTDVATVQNSDLSNLSSVAISAYTVVMANVNLSGAVSLTCFNHVLAPNPNTGAAIIPGDVNFKTGVMYQGAPAQQFVGSYITIH